MTNQTTILQVADLSLIYAGQVILQDISLTLQSGEFVALLGPNGAGKSSLVRSLLGLMPGRVIGRINFLIDRHHLAYIPQTTPTEYLLPLTVQELFLTKLRIQSFFRPKKNVIEQILKYLKQFNVGYTLQDNFSQLSGGEKQRVLMAYALFSQPKLLILDEPISAVDQIGSQTFFETLHKLREQGLTILLVSHDMDLVARYVDRVICLNRRIICQGKPKETLTTETIDCLYKDKIQHYHHQH